MKVGILVVLYGKEIYSSKTIQSLSEVDFDSREELNFHIINNGPEKVDLNSVSRCNIICENIIFEEHLENRPLSVIYNDFLDRYDYDKYILFDDDTTITKDFFNTISIEYSGIDLQIPLIREIKDKKIYYPLVDGVICNGYGLINNSSLVYSIGSGLVINKKIKSKFRDMKLFDDRFALYGVDISFFRRIAILKNKGIEINILCKGELNHLLSRNSDEKSYFRDLERGYDTVLSLKYYIRNPFKKYYHLISFFLRNIIKLNFRVVFKSLKVFINGSHPRCN